MIRIAFFSNFLNHHQLPFCLNMMDNPEIEFVFVAIEPISADRLAMGYMDMNHAYPFVLRAYEGQQEMAKAQQIADTWDVVISGSSPEELLKNRLKANKLTFHYNERIYKRGVWRALSPRGLMYMYKNHARYRNHNSYLLCASAYTAGDFRITGSYLGKTYKWGYFPEVKEQNLDALLAEKYPSGPVNLFWAGRMLDWKHPELALHAAKHLRDKGIPFTMDIVGDGDVRPDLERFAQDNGLSDVVRFHGFQSPETVRDFMEKANIYLFTSDYNEGWGAVLNEAMNGGCAVIANHAIGSVPFMLQNGKNGIIYNNEAIQSYFDAVEALAKNPERCTELGRAAYKTVAEQWNAKTAAERLVHLCKALLDGKSTDYRTGPCSPAEPIFQWNMYKKVIRGE